MHIGQIYKADIANGIGVRISLFVSGCTIHCENCFNSEAWDFDYGKEYTQEIEDELIEKLSLSQYNGLTILGGEPFEFKNQSVLKDLILRIKRELPEKTIWIYTGNIYDRDLVPGGYRYYPNLTDIILDNIDILVDGPFMKDYCNLTLKFRGSENQRIIDMKQTRKTNKIILDKLNEFTPMKRGDL
jgi:anaerobic ribonucleoside-triphosphate reductase activating protein